MTNTAAFPPASPPPTPSIYKGLTWNLGFVWEASSTLNFRLFGINPLCSGLVGMFYFALQSSLVPPFWFIDFKWFK